MFYFICTYGVIGVLFSLYILGAHCRAELEYIRQLYTSKNLRPSDIKTYFGLQYWSNDDNWGEVILMTTIQSLLFAIFFLFGWPICIFFFLNRSIQRARERIENE